MKPITLLFTFLFFFFHSLQARDTLIVKNLVFEGAGIRGIAYGGVITAMEEKGMLDSLQRVGGTSAGAIAAMALCVGYNGKEITDLISSTRFSSFNDGHYMFIGGFNRMNCYYGWYRGQQVDQWLANLIAMKTGNPDLTFQQLHDHPVYKDLYVTGTCVNLQKTIVFSYENYPHMKIKDAVRISMSIPFYFEAVMMDQQGSLVNHPKNTQEYYIMIDGGVTANFPIHLFDSTKYSQDTTNRYQVNYETLAVRVDSQQQIENDQQGSGLAAMEVNDFKSYTSAMYVLVLENLNRSGLSAEDWSRTISVSDEGLSPRIRKLSDKETQGLYQSGLNAVYLYCRNKE